MASLVTYPVSDKRKREFCVLVDDDDLALVSRYSWVRRQIGRNEYAVTMIDGKWQRMHRMILGVPTTVGVDHINGNGLDNRRENLRFCSHAQNMQNSRRRNGQVGLKGVTYYPKKYRFRPYVAQIMADRKPRFLGCFATAEEAHAAYCAAAKVLHGEFARFD